MDWQTFTLMDLARERDDRRMAEHGPERPTYAASDYEVAAVTVFPPLGAAGDWRRRVTRVLDRRLQAGLLAR
ncbi:MAG: hypothetical protein IT340_08630 [Chloroflexi bacterium]|nr:hypothetical protein [Chloroflexota bacterium]